MKELNLVFLEKSELQLQGNSMLCAFFSFTPSMWLSQKDMYQDDFEKKVFSDTRETKRVKKTANKMRERKFNYCFAQYDL